MIGRVAQALVFGAVVTALEVFLVSRFNTPADHPEEQRPERGKVAPVVTAPPPEPVSSAFEAPAPLAIDRVAPAPAPALAPSLMPELGDTHAGVALSNALPGLSGLRSSGRFGAVGVPSPPPPEQADQAAVPRERPAPRYPDVARRRGIEGYVVVRMRVDADGRVSDVVVVDAKPPGVFDLAAKQAARRYTFQPARTGGEAVATTLEQRIVFRLR